MSMKLLLYKTHRNDLIINSVLIACLQSPCVTSLPQLPGGTEAAAVTWARSSQTSKPDGNCVGLWTTAAAIGVILN